MKFISTIGLLVIAISAQAVFAHHEHDDDSHACAQPKYELPAGEISCLALMKSWYHEHSSGECKERDYDGCHKNANHFETKEECDKVCGEWHEAHKGHDHQHKHGADCSHDHDHSHHHH